MNKKTAKAKALEASIAHWIRMRDAKTVASLGTELPGPTDCALCKLFRRDFKCAGCPVFERTGRHSCRGTPYLVSESAFHRWRTFNNKPNTRSAWRRAAKKEIAFLESLREPKK